MRRPLCAGHELPGGAAIDEGRLANWLGLRRELARQVQRETRRTRDAGMRDDAEMKRVGRRSSRRAEKRRLRAG